METAVGKVEKEKVEEAEPSSSHHLVLESARKSVKTSIDLIRLAAYPGAKWNAQSISNALSWLDQTQTWIRDVKLRDKQGKVIQDVTALLPSEWSSFEFEQLVTAKDVFVRTLLRRPCSHQGFAEMVKILSSSTSTSASTNSGSGCGSRASKESKRVWSGVKDSWGYYTSQVSCLNSQLQLVSLLLEQRKTQAVREAEVPPKPNAIANAADVADAVVDVDVDVDVDVVAGGGSDLVGVSWSAFVEYLLSWRVVCLCAFLRLGVNESKNEGERERIVNVVFSHLKQQQQQQKHSATTDEPAATAVPNVISGVECCCILLLSHIWFDVIEAASSSSFFSVKSTKTKSRRLIHYRETGSDPGLLPEHLKRSVMQKLIETFATSEQNRNNKNQGEGQRHYHHHRRELKFKTLTHPALLATLAIEYKREFLPVYRQWIDSLHEWSGEKTEHQRWLALAQSCI